jgi:Polysaccharide deacetylase
MVRYKKAIKNLYGNFPQPGRRMLSRLDYRLASIPFIYRVRGSHPDQGLQRGAVVFSLDFEMAWAWQYSKNTGEDFVAKGLHEREMTPRLIGAFEEYSLPATWATVGHLFLDSCQRGHDGLAHPDIVHPGHFENQFWTFQSGDWYQYDPCSNVRNDPAWYAPDLIGQILESRVKHEIACHSFSHISFGACSGEVAAAELDACFEAMRPYGLTPSTWVFPRHDEGNFKVLADHGFKIVRSFPRTWAKLTLPLLRDDGMWGVHVSTAIDRGDRWPMEDRLLRLKTFADAAARSRMAAHIWFHPSLPRREMTDLLFPFLRYCADMRERGELDILTMEGLVEATATALGTEQNHTQPRVPERPKEILR